MKNIITNIFKVTIIIAIVAWICLIFVDYFKVQEGSDPVFCVSRNTKKYDDGTVYVCTGLGYKVYQYNRKSISAVEFGPFFIQERTP